PDRLPVGIFYHYKIKASGWLLCLLLRCGSDYEGCQSESGKQAASHDRLLYLNLSRHRSYKDCRHSYDLPSANTLMHEHGRQQDRENRLQATGDHSARRIEILQSVKKTNVRQQHRKAGKEEKELPLSATEMLRGQ